MRLRNSRARIRSSLPDWPLPRAHWSARRSCVSTADSTRTAFSRPCPTRGQQIVVSVSLVPQPVFLPCLSIGGIFERRRRTCDRYDSNHGRLFSSLSFSFSQSFLASRLFNPSFSFTLQPVFFHRRRRLSLSLFLFFSLCSSFIRFLCRARENSLSAAKQRDPPDEI